MKLCCDCKYSDRGNGWGLWFSMCYHPKQRRSPSHGYIEPEFCDTVREWGGCGMDAEWWEPRPRPLNRLRNLVSRLLEPLTK